VRGHAQHQRLLKLPKFHLGRWTPDNSLRPQRNSVLLRRGQCLICIYNLRALASTKASIHGLQNRPAQTSPPAMAAACVLAVVSTTVASE
jgi:hypothetical protein